MSSSKENRWEHSAHAYEKAMSLYPECRMDYQKMIEDACLSEKSVVLEIGGGTGYITEKIASIVKKGEIIVNDVSKKAIDISKSKSIDRVSYFMGQVSELPDSKFDAIVSLGAFHHIYNQYQLVEDIYKKLKDGGVACIADFADDSDIQRYFDERVHQNTPTGHYALFPSKSHVVNMARKAGFSDDKIKTEPSRARFVFHDKREAAHFFNLCFYITHQTVEQTLCELEQYFEFEEDTQRGKIALLMDYLYIRLEKGLD